MSVSNIVRNIKQNILDREDDDDLLVSLELITKMPLTFKKMLDENPELSRYKKIYKEQKYEENSDELSDEENDSEENIIPTEKLKYKTTGFRHPFKISDNLRDFISEGNFGIFTNRLSLLKTKISTPVILTKLMKLYVKYNIPYDSSNRKNIFKATPLMLKYFKKDFLRLKLSINFFRFQNFQSLLRCNMEKLEGYDDETLDLLDQDTTFLS